MPRNALLIAFFIVFISCADHPVNNKVPQSFISFSVDSFKIYPIDSLSSTYGFFFNPFTAHDKVWIFNYNQKRELDLLSGEVAALIDQYHLSNISSFHGSTLWTDSISGEIFVAPYSDALYYYTPEVDSFVRINLRTVEGLVNTKEKIVAGTSAGLFFINKRTKEITKAPNQPEGTYVKQITIVNSDYLTFNHGRQDYQTHLEEISRLKKYYNFSGGDRQYMIDHEYLFFNLPKENYSEQYYRVENDSLKALYSNNHLFYFDSSAVVRKVNAVPQGDIVQIQSDPLYWYILYNNKFVILNKTYASSKSTIYDTQKYGQQMQKCTFDIGKINLLSIDSFISKYQSIINDSTCHSLPGYEYYLNRAIEAYFGYSSPDRLIEFEEAYGADKFPPQFEKPVIMTLINYYVHQFNIRKVRELIKTLDSKYPDYQVDYRKSVLSCYERIFNSVDSLKALNLPRVEYLFQEAKIKVRIVFCGGFGDSFYDFSLSEENYNQILSEFPKSSYAEEIEFYRAGSEGLDPESGEPETMEGLISLDRFIKKYPDSKFGGRIDLKKASLMSMYYMSSDSILWYKDKAMEILKNIKPKYLQDTTFRNEVFNQIASLERDINEMALEFTITTTDSVFSEHGVTINIKILNKTDKPRSILRYAKAPYFLIYVNPEPGVDFQIQNNNTDTTSMEVIIPAGGVIKDVMKLPGKVRKLVYPKNILYGNLSFNRDGFYTIEAIGPKYKFYSNTLNLHYKK